MTRHYLRYLLGNLLLAVALLALWFPGWWIWGVTVLVLAAGGPLDEAAGDAESALSDLNRRFFEINLYSTLPLLALMTLAMLRLVATAFGSGYVPRAEAVPSWDQVAAAVFLVGYCYAVFGATVGHELTHRTGVRAAYWSARGLFAPTFNTAFTTFHVHGHHRKVATLADPATARRGEYILAFMIRTVWEQFVDAVRFEAARLRRGGFNPFGLHNRAISGQIVSLAALAVAVILAGLPGGIAYLLAGAIGRFFHELVNYVQHFGLVRLEGSPIEQRHTWDCWRFLSNVLHYNLPMHADHHMFAGKSFWQLERAANAPLLPHGYQTMAAIALVPPLWRRTMTPLLADWDAHFASEAEREIVRQRGWDRL